MTRSCLAHVRQVSSLNFSLGLPISSLQNDGGSKTEGKMTIERFMFTKMMLYSEIWNDCILIMSDEAHFHKRIADTFREIISEESIKGPYRSERVTVLWNKLFGIIGLYFFNGHTVTVNSQCYLMISRNFWCLNWEDIRLPSVGFVCNRMGLLAIPTSRKPMLFNGTFFRMPHYTGMWSVVSWITESFTK